MLRLDGHAAVLAGFVASEENYAAGFFGESFEHTASHLFGDCRDTSISFPGMSINLCKRGYHRGNGEDKVGAALDRAAVLAAIRRSRWQERTSEKGCKWARIAWT